MASSLLRLSRPSLVLGVRAFGRLSPAIPDPERPTRPLSPWLRYLDVARKGKAPNTGNKVFLSEASVLWKALPAQEKSKYLQPYEAEKKAYEEKMKAYVDSGKKDAWNRDPARPKSPMTPYLMYLADFRAQKPEMKILDAAKAGAVEWKTLAQEKKKPYLDKYAAAKEKYAKDFEAYKKSGKEEAWKTKVGIIAKEQKEKETMMKDSAKKGEANNKLQKIKEKEKLAATKQKEKEKLATRRKKEQERASKIKALERAKKLKQNAKESALKLQAKEKAKKEKEREQAKKAREKTLKLSKEKAKHEKSRTAKVKAQEALGRAKVSILKGKGTIAKPTAQAMNKKVITKAKALK